ncbi:phage tail protein [Listeria innocua]|nr:phage tail protein [Listeria innocua]EIS1577265.1 phage tail protein [Listeria monocytogenes]
MVERNLNIPLLYEADETEFLHSGICSLSETVRCEVHEVMNAEFELELEYPVNGSHAHDLINGRYISAFVDSQRGYNPFEIDTVEKNLFADTFIIKASHQTNKLRKKMIKEFKVDKVSCGTAMNRLKDSLLEPTNIEFYSDISTLNSTFLRFKNALSCIGGVEGSILDTWRGEIERTTNKISMLKKRGTDSGVVIAYRKNMTGLNINTDTLDMVNAIMPYAIKTVNDSDTVISLSENYIYSPDFVAGNEINAVEIDYSSDENVIDEKTLRSVAKNYFSSSVINEPILDLEISFQDLGQTEEYKMFQNMNRVFIGDTLSVFHDELNVQTTARMVEFTMDSLRGEYVNCTVGSVKSDLKSTMTAGMATKDEIEAGDNRMQEYVDDLTKQITGNQGGNLVIRPPEKPAEMLIMDTDNISTAVNLWRFNQMGLGHSKTGYNGEYTIGLTQDGKIVADLIATGTLRAIDIEGVTITGSSGHFDVLYSSFLPGLPAPQYREELQMGGGTGFNLQAQSTTKPYPAMQVRLNTNGDLGLAIEAVNENTGAIDADRVVRLSPFAGIETPLIQSDGWCCIGANPDGKTASIDRYTWVSGGGPQLRYVPHRASNFETASSEEYKKNIRKVKKTAFGKTAKQVITETDVYTYSHIADKTNEKKIGFIAEQASDSLTTADGKAIDLYNSVAWLYQYAKENEAEKEALKAEVKELKDLVNKLVNEVNK